MKWLCVLLIVWGLIVVGFVLLVPGEQTALSLLGGACVGCGVGTLGSLLVLDGGAK